MASFAENGRSGNHFVSYYLLLFDHLSLTLFLLVLPFVWYRNHGEDHMIQEGESNIAVNVGGAFLSLPSLRYLNLTFYRQEHCLV